MREGYNSLEYVTINSLFTAIFLFLNQSNHTLNFNESDGVIEDIVRIQKENDSPETEVDITVQLIIDNTTTTGMVHYCVYA